MNGKKRAILFDKDGTLIHYNTIWPDAIRAMIPLFREKFAVKKNVLDDQLLSQLGLNGQLVNDSTPIASGTSSNIAYVLNQALETGHDDVLSFVRDYFYQYTIANQDKIQAIGNVKDLFTNLKAQGYTLGVITADDYESTIFTIKHLKIDELIEFVATGDRYKAKPSSEAMTSFSSELGFDPDQILFVGDSIIDMQFGKHFRTGIAVLSGVGLREELMEYTDYCYQTIHDIPYDTFFTK